jgi:dTDP-4-dehydrorhamnose 3,5-epimerase
MRFIETAVSGAFVVEPDLIEDERGFFARIWCQQEFGVHGLNSGLVQCSISFNRARGTLRGLHYQVAPHEEAKLVRCTMGAIYDAVLDLRPDSSTFGAHEAVVLTARNRLMLYVPEGCAHGFLTLEDDTEVAYQMSEFYAPGAGRGVRWDDPTFGIRWPGEVRVVAERDRTYPDIDLAVVARPT